MFDCNEFRQGFNADRNPHDNPHDIEGVRKKGRYDVRTGVGCSGDLNGGVLAS